MTEIGAVLAGKYRVLAKLGEGGMGSVFRAENLLTGKQVALKCLHPHITASRDASERLLREARASASLSHPNVVDVYDVVRDGETLFLVMELLRGETLRAYLTRNVQPKISDFIGLILPALSGVAAAHERGVIHRDLKPDNIFVADVAGAAGPVVKVLDFGIAKLATANGPTLTQTGAAIGTPLYMSLEQLRGDKNIDQRADVYAFGVMLYEAVTGAPPYEAETLPELAIKVATTDPAPVKSLRPDIPTPLARIIDWAVMRERDQRLPDIATFKRELDVFAREHSFRDQMTKPEAAMPRLAVEGGAADGGQAQPQPPAASPAVAKVGARKPEPDTLRARELLSRSEPRTSRSRWALGGVGLVGALAGAGFLLTRPTPPPAAAPESLPPVSAPKPTATGVSAATQSPPPSAAPASAASSDGPSPLSAPGSVVKGPPSAAAAVPTARGAAAPVAAEKVADTQAVQARTEVSTPGAQPVKTSAARAPVTPVPGDSAPAKTTAPSQPAVKPVQPAVAKAVTQPVASKTATQTAPAASASPAAKVSPAVAPAPAKKKTSELVGF